MLLPLTLALVIFLLLLELSGDIVYMEKAFFPLGWSRGEFPEVCHGLAHTRGNTIHDEIVNMLVHHLGIDVESIDIIKVCLHHIYLPTITNLIKSYMQLVPVSIVFSDFIRDLFPGIILLPASFTPC